MKKHLESQIKYSDKKLTEMKTKLMANYCSQLPWLGEDIYKYEFKLDHYKSMLSDFDKHTEEEILVYWIEKFTTFIKHSYNVRENSTGSLFRECSTWKYICTIELLEELKSIK